MASGNGLMAEFESVEMLRQVIRRLRELGYERLNAYLPFPDDQVLHQIAPRPVRLVQIAGAAGAVGAVFGYTLQWFLNAHDYPLDVGGRPPHAVAAFLPITFEMGVLFAAVTMFSAVLLRSGIPSLWRPEFEVEGFESASVDGFWVFVSVRDARFDWERTREQLASFRPLKIGVCPTGERTP